MSALKVYSYRAVGADGELTSGTMPGDGERQVVLALQKRGLTPVAITLGGSAKGASKGSPAGAFAGSVARAGKKGGRPASPRLISSKQAGHGKQGRLRQLASMEFRFSSGKKVSNATLANFAENLSMLLTSGIPLDKSMAIITELTDTGAFREIVDDLHGRIREGESLGDALLQHPKTFPPVFVSMVTAGEKGGILESVLNKLTDYLKSAQEVREFLISSMIYPAILAFVAGLSVIVLLTFVMPQFATIFDDMGADVPAPARVMLALGDFLNAYWWVLLLSAVSAWLGVRSYARTPAGRRKLDRWKMTAPVAKGIYTRIEIGHFARTLSTLLSNGVPILSSLNIVRGVVQNSVFRSHMDTTFQRVKEGGELSVCLAEADYMPSLAVHMVRVGEQTGRLDAMLGKVADVFDKELRTAIKRFTSLLEPVIILVLGLVIGVMVVSILMAVLSINEVGM